MTDVGGMRVVVTGATGNVGTSLLRALAAERSVGQVVGLARRRPAMTVPKTTWAVADIGADDLRPLFENADAVIHLAWLIQPGRNLHTTARANIDGSARVFAAAADAGVSVLVHASSIGTYSAGPADLAVDESWPTHGVATSFYARDKAYVERMLDAFECAHPGIRVVRMRPALIFKRDAASGIRRLFLGPFAPTGLLRAGRVWLLPDIPGLQLQAVHTEDVAEAYRAALVRPVRGAFNLAAEPVLDMPTIARILGARLVRIPPAAARAAATATFRLRLQPSEPGWVDMALGVPLLDTSRARKELEWAPKHTADEALRQLLAGLAHHAGLPTPPLDPRTGGPLRVREVQTGIGGSSGV